jgi:hypothetical protein
MNGNGVGRPDGVATKTWRRESGMSSAAVLQRSSVVPALPSPTFPAPSAVNRSELTKADWPDANATVVVGGSDCMALAANPFMSGHAPSVGVGRGEVVAQ